MEVIIVHVLKRRNGERCVKFLSGDGVHGSLKEPLAFDCISSEPSPGSSTSTTRATNDTTMNNDAWYLRTSKLYGSHVNRRGPARGGMSDDGSWDEFSQA